MRKILSFFTLLLFGSYAFADSSSSFLNPQAISNHTDLAVNYLSQIFGNVSGVLAGNGSQMMGKLFYVLNNGILLAAVIVISYAVLMGTIRLASEGVSIAQGKSTLFSLLKLSIGVALIVPSPSTGYSTLQTLVMKVVVEGVGLADSVWDHGLDYLKEGGLMWAKPTGGAAKSQANLVTDKNIKGLFSADNKLATQIFANAVCMYGSRDPLTNVASSSTSNPVAADASTRPNYSVWTNESAHTFNFPGLNDQSAASGSACGRVSWDVSQACSTGSDADAKATNCATARQAMSSLITAILPLAHKYYCSETATQTGTCSGITPATNDYAYSTLYNGLLNYYSSMQVYADIKMAKNDSHNPAKNSDNTRFIAGAKKEGWLNAGRYYWDLMRFTANAQSDEDLSTYVVQATAPNAEQLAPYSLKSIVESAPNKIAGSSHSYVIGNNQAITQGFADYVNQVYGQAGQADSSAANANSKPNIISGAAAEVIAPAYLVPGVGAALTMAAAGLDSIGKQFADPDPNPIQFLYKIGQASLSLTVNIWIIGGSLVFLSMLGFGVCQASNPLAVAGQTLASWFQPLVTMIATMLWASGFFLSYYVPLYPFMVFLFASLGWFISVIEAMVAAPLVALGLTHPDNHDLLGKAEQAVMLLLGVFIQPSLLVIGLIAGIIVSFVTFQLLIYSFSGFVMDVMGTASNSSHSTNILHSVVNGSKLWDGSILLTQPLLLVVFCVLVYTLLTQSFSLVFLLRDNVMRWIGAPGSGLPNPEQLVGDTRSTISGAGRSTGDASAQVGGASMDVSKGAESGSARVAKGAKAGASGAKNMISGKQGAGADPNAQIKKRGN